jgi:hypothetical protein
MPLSAPEDVDAKSKPIHASRTKAPARLWKTVMSLFVSSTKRQIVTLSPFVTDINEYAFAGKTDWAMAIANTRTTAAISDPASRSGD